MITYTDLDTKVMVKFFVQDEDPDEKEIETLIRDSEKKRVNPTPIRDIVMGKLTEITEKEYHRLLT